MELDAPREINSEVNVLGAQIVVLTPELERYTRNLHKKLNLAFDRLTDLHLRERYKSFGSTLDRLHDQPEYRLPMPARYVSDKEDIIGAADVNADYPIRPEPSETVEGYEEADSVMHETPSIISSRECRGRQGLQFRVKKQMTSTWYSSRRVAETYSGFKTLIEEHTDRILGAHLLGGQAEEVINLFAVAMPSGMSATDLRRTILSYPTHSSDVPYML